MAGASSDISEEMTKSSFLKCPNHDVLTLFFRNHILCFLLPLFFVKVQSKIGVRIIHGHALYTGKYGMLIFFLQDTKIFCQLILEGLKRNSQHCKL